MVEESYTEVTHQSWFSRLGGAFKGIIAGLILFVIAFPLLFWNEGRAVKRYKTLKEGGGAVISVPVDKVDGANGGKLIHVTGKADTQERLTDPVFNISSKAIKLKRTVEMYQWNESASSETKKKLGGSTETVTTYTYNKIWSTSVLSSSSFKQQQGHQNPGTMPFQSTEQVAAKVQLGAFQLSSSLIHSMDNYSALPLMDKSALPSSLRDKVLVHDAKIYMGKNPVSPSVGDVRIAFEIIKPVQISVIAQQVGNTFEPYRSKVGGTIELLQTGSHSADAMIQSAQDANKVMTWILRAVGLFLMAIGLKIVLKPLSVLADVLPILGNILESGTGFIAFLLAGVLSLVTIAIAWLFYRPLIGLGLIALAGCLLWVIRVKLKKTGQSQPQAAA